MGTTPGGLGSRAFEDAMPIGLRHATHDDADKTPALLHAELERRPRVGLFLLVVALLSSGGVFLARHDSQPIAAPPSSSPPTTARPRPSDPRPVPPPTAVPSPASVVYENSSAAPTYAPPTTYPSTTTSFTPHPTTKVVPDPSVHQAVNDLRVTITPVVPALTVGRHNAIIVTVENRSRTTTYRAQGSCEWAISGHVDDDRLPSRSDLSPSHGFQSDGDPLRWFLSWRDQEDLSESLRTEPQGQDCPMVPNVAGERPSEVPGLRPGEAMSHTFDVELSSLAPRRHPDQVMITASFDLRAIGWTGPPIRASIAYPVVDPADRETAYLQSVMSVGREAQVLGWVVDHQGRMGDPHHGVGVDRAYRDGAWTFSFTGSRGQPSSFSRLDVTTDPAGAVVSMGETPVVVSTCTL